MALPIGYNPCNLWGSGVFSTLDSWASYLSVYLEVAGDSSKIFLISDASKLAGVKKRFHGW